VQYCWNPKGTCTYAWGTLPSSDFRAGGGHASLSTTLEDGYSETCSWDWRLPWPDAYVCESSSAAGQTVDVSWQGDGAWSNSYSGVSKGNWGKYAYRSQGNWRSQSAMANGVAFGREFVDASGDINHGHNVSRDTYVEPEPPLVIK
jgi:hypothetical protein